MLPAGLIRPAPGYGAQMINGPEARRFQPTRHCDYEGWTVVELKKRAKQLGISGYSGLSKEKLISLIRSY